MDEQEEQEILNKLHKEKKDLSILNKKDLTSEELDELFAEA